MTLSGLEIQRQVELGNILVDPWDPSLLNPISLDVRLGSTVLMYSEEPGGVTFDCRDPKTLVAPHRFEIGPEGFLLRPGRLYLMHTAERIVTPKYEPRIEGKSSIGRLGVQVHMTAGFGDPGFAGQYTLEVTAMYRTRVYAGMRFCQMRFAAIEGQIKLYDGNYTGEFSMGPQPSRVWKQFEAAPPTPPEEEEDDDEDGEPVVVTPRPFVIPDQLEAERRFAESSGLAERTRIYKETKKREEEFDAIGVPKVAGKIVTVVCALSDKEAPRAHSGLVLASWVVPDAQGVVKQAPMRVRFTRTSGQPDTIKEFDRLVDKWRLGPSWA